MSTEKIIPRFTLNQMHFGNLSVPRKPVAALEWWTHNIVGVDWDSMDITPREFDALFKWYLSAAEQGEAYAQTIIGLLYVWGPDVQYTAALKWYTQAAKRGNTKAAEFLGWIYSEGRGVPQDLVRGVMWLNIAGSSVEYWGFDKDMTPAEIEEAKKLARDWMKKHRIVK